jgi:outer membrane protein assembly factor BamB
MMRRLGVVQRYMCSCSVTAAGDLLLVNTSNGVDTDDKLPAPEAPSFIALNKHSGALVWADHSPGRNILEGQWSSPAFAVLGGVPQAIFAGGDGWLYSFVAEPAPDRQARLLWKFDANPKDAVWKGGGNGRRNHIIATPVIYDGRVYIGTGQDPEAGEGPGDLWCIDPARRGDVSAELVVDRQGKPVPPRRLQAVDKDAGEQVRPNPNSAAVWHYRGPQTKSAGPDDFKKTMHRTLGTGAIRSGLLVVGDFAGLVHCLDARTGQVQWTYDTMAAIWGGPLIVEGKVYLGNEDGDVLVFELGRSCKLLAKNNMANSVFSSPAVAHNVLYISTRGHLFAIARGRD